MITEIAREYGQDWEVNYNHSVRQHYGNDCAVYSLYYLTNRIKGVSFSELASQELRPEDIYRYRRHYFRPECP